MYIYIYMYTSLSLSIYIYVYIYIYIYLQSNTASVGRHHAGGDPPAHQACQGGRGIRALHSTNYDISYHIISYYTLLYHIVSYYIISYYIIFIISYSEDRFFSPPPPPPRGGGVYKLLSQFLHVCSL